MKRRPETGVAALALVLVATGAMFELLGRPARLPEAGAPSGSRLVARTVYCPPAASTGARVRVAVGGVPQQGARVGVGRRMLAPGGGDMVAGRPGTRDPVDVVGYGASVEAATVTAAAAPATGAGAAGCAATAGRDWYFAEGTSTLGNDQRLLVYNPFPDEAVVRVTLFTPRGPRETAGLSDVAVPSGSYTSVSINRFVRIQPVLAARVHAVRGRVVAWRALFAEPRRGVDGLGMTLGAPAPSKTWLFADGAVGKGYRERITILNPSAKEAVVSISLPTEQGMVQPPKLVDLVVPGDTARPVLLDEAEGALRAGISGVGAVVTSTNGVPVVAERSVEYSTATATGLAAEVGIPRPVRDWFLGPAADSADFDAVALLNPGRRRTKLTITFERLEGGRLAPERLAGIALKPGHRVKIPVTTYTEGGFMVVRVTAGLPVVAERFAYSRGQRDVAAVMGLPLRRIAP